MSTPKPWSNEKLRHVQDKLTKQAAGVAKRMKAESCIVIAFFGEGDQIHILEGGQSPVPLPELYEMRREIWTKIANAGLEPTEDRKETVQ